MALILESALAPAASSLHLIWMKGYGFKLIDQILPWLDLQSLNMGEKDCRADGLSEDHAARPRSHPRRLPRSTRAAILPSLLLDASEYECEVEVGATAQQPQPQPTGLGSQDRPLGTQPGPSQRASILNGGLDRLP